MGCVGPALTLVSGIPWAVVNRSKGLTGPERAANRAAVVKFVRQRVRVA